MFGSQNHRGWKITSLKTGKIFDAAVEAVWGGVHSMQGCKLPAASSSSSVLLSTPVPQVNYWQSRQCNMINGTAGEMWPPFMSPTSLEFYSPDACR